MRPFKSVQGLPPEYFEISSKETRLPEAFASQAASILRAILR
jgi:hypothetical protein